MNLSHMEHISTCLTLISSTSEYHQESDLDVGTLNDVKKALSFQGNETQKLALMYAQMFQTLKCLHLPWHIMQIIKNLKFITKTYMLGDKEK